MSSTEPIRFAPGNYVLARGRDWVVLPESTDDLLMLRPLGGMDEEITGILPALELVEPATFAPPNPTLPGDFHSCRLLRDAANLSTRAAAGPFRSFARIAVEPRPYQLVPLLMAMRLDPVRLLIADDVGIGKTIETAMIVRELLDRGEIDRFAVLCPPHLAEQWQRELSQKFHLDAELVLTSTIRRLEKGLRPGDSVFDRHPYVIISTDFIKSPRRRDDFIRTCPELVVVDEAHTCTLADKVGRARQERNELVRRLAGDTDRHVLLVTATPHSGNENAFRSLLSLLDQRFADLPTDLEAATRSKLRKDLARHLVQRRRADIRDYLGTETIFPDREDKEEAYDLGPEYGKLFDKVLEFARELVVDEAGGRRQRRVRWWSALALLRALASSPRAAAATLRNRAATADAETEEEADELGRRAVLDLEEVDSEEVFDFTPGADPTEEDAPDQTTRKRLLALAREADHLAGAKDAKLQQATGLVKELLKLGHNPILFCRFIDTAEYVAEELRGKFKDVEVAAVTGRLPPKEREGRIEDLGEHKRRILVCTDCLSEGVNLQDHFDAVIHYDLSWNPTRHEQREGRVDRFGQPRATVRVVTYFGRDNKIDGVVLDVLLRKHKQIRSDLGISVAVPADSESVLEALFEGLVLRSDVSGVQQLLPFEDLVERERKQVHKEWTKAAEREKKSRSIYAQRTIGTDEVETEWAAAREAMGGTQVVRNFVLNSLHMAGVAITDLPNDTVRVEIDNETARALRNAMGMNSTFQGRFDLPVDEGTYYLARTHPIVEGLASYVLDMALDEVLAETERPIARRCGLTRTTAVKRKTTVLLVRFRYFLNVKTRTGGERPLLAEEIRPLAFCGSIQEPEWLGETAAEQLLLAKPAGNVAASLVNDQVSHLVDNLAAIRPGLDSMAKERAEKVREAHVRVRKSAAVPGRVQVGAVDTPDLLGCFILLPGSSSQA